MRGILILRSILLAVAIVGLPVGVALGASLVQLSSDPYTNPDSQHATEVEPDTFAFGTTIVSAFQVGRIFDGGSSNIGFATSVNSGASWTHGFLPASTVNATPPGVYQRTSDPSVAFDAKHAEWIISYLGLFPNGNSSQVDVLVSRSVDGVSWGNPVVVNGDGHFNDKNWTVCDNTASSPFYGNCYTEFDDNTLGDLIQMSTSTNGGQTWAAPLPTANNAHGIGGQPVVQPGGTVIVPIVGFAGYTFLMLSFTSSNGGASWTKTMPVAHVAFHLPAGGLRASIPLPSAEVDGAGKVFVVWSDCHFEPTCGASDLVMSTSSDGVKWSKLSRIPLDPIGSGVDHFIPGLAVNKSTAGSSANLALTYYYYPNASCTTATCQLDLGLATSADGGATWSPAAQIAGPLTLTWLPNTTQGYMVGDYISASFAGTLAYPAFAVATAPSGGVFNETIDTIQGGVTAGGSAISATDQATSATTVPGGRSSVTAQ
jgi:hypothetical protein